MAQVFGALHPSGGPQQKLLAPVLWFLASDCIVLDQLGSALIVAAMGERISRYKICFFLSVNLPFK